MPAFPVSLRHYFTSKYKHTRTFFCFISLMTGSWYPLTTLATSPRPRLWSPQSARGVPEFMSPWGFHTEEPSGGISLCLACLTPSNALKVHLHCCNGKISKTSERDQMLDKNVQTDVQAPVTRGLSTSLQRAAWDTGHHPQSPRAPPAA